VATTFNGLGLVATAARSIYPSGRAKRKYLSPTTTVHLTKNTLYRPVYGTTCPEG
jgi:hypothetical protein